ncbi:MAG TPA: site-specific tyrosine recombinase XerC [Gammaproteobacteria bacterium]|nr:site-specific tyrosine recombinase XerC [Gammaproteobacteria bacterium]
MYKKKPPKPYPKKPDPHPIDHHGMTPYLATFLEWCAMKGYSERTITIRDLHLKRFIRWCDDRGLDQPQDITRPILERYRRHVYYYRKKDGKPLSLATQCQRLAPIKAFFQWLTKENHILYNPASELELPRQPKKLPQHILSVEEVEQVLDQASLHGERGIRDRAIIETLYSTGIRRTEAVNLKLYDIDLNHGTLMVRQGKGGKDRLVPLGERACAWLTKYIDEVRSTFVMEPDDGTLFLTEYGQPMIKNRLSDTVKKHIDAAGIMKPGACHLFRHAMATHMLENGADIRFIQMMLGHSTLSTTEIYTQVSIKKLKAIHAATHPARLARAKTADKTMPGLDTHQAARIVGDADPEEI